MSQNNGDLREKSTVHANLGLAFQEESSTPHPEKTALFWRDEGKCGY